jgi:hypothetical protein
MSIFVIKDINAQRANIQQTHYLVSPAPVFAAVMLGHAIAARIGKRDIGVGLIHHSASPHIEHIPNTNGWINSFPCQFRGATGDIASGGKGPMQNSMQPAVTGDLNVSLILNVEDGADILDVRKAINSMGLRLAGGKVPYSPTLHEADNLYSAIRMCGRGYWVSDATQTVRARLAEGMPIVEAVLGRVTGGWYVPATLGYRALTRIEQRSGARDGLDHAYGEPVVGLVRYDSVFSLFRDEGSQPALWSHDWITDSMFVVHQPQ